MSDIIHLSDRKSESSNEEKPKAKQTRVVHLNKEPYDVYIGRPSKWGNPFPSGKDRTKAEAIRLFEEYLLGNKELMDSLHELEGKTIACWCKPSACHGDVIVRLINEQKLFDF